MNDILNTIDNAKHVMIVTDVGSLSGASALYTHILRLHKKVSLVCMEKNISCKFSFLPWFDKIKSTKVASADFIVEFHYDSVELYDFFKKLNIKINNKMATALYGGLLFDSECFSNSRVNGTTFAMAKELIESGAEHKVCNDFICRRTTLANLRLQALMLGNMTLLNSAKVALFCISDADMKSTGATLDECYVVMKEALKLPTVEISLLLDMDNEYENLKLIYKEM